MYNINKIGMPIYPRNIRIKHDFFFFKLFKSGIPRTGEKIRDIDSFDS